jgi:hypothetical protein
MPAWEVETACLHEVGRTLVEVSDLLAGASGALGREAEGTLGSDRLDAALREFARGWGQRVRELGETSATLGQLLVEAARGYGLVESRLTQAMDGAP